MSALTSRLLHGALLGAAAGALASLAETAAVLERFPYQRDPALWASVLPLYAGAGTLAGLAGAALAPVVAGRRRQDRDPRLATAASVLGALATLAALVLLHLAWLPASWPSTGVPALAASLGLLLAGALLSRILARVLCGAWGWVLGFFLAPPTAGLLVLLAAAAALLSPLLPVADAPVSTRVPAPAGGGAPNVLLIVLDTVSARHLGTYGYEHDTDPALAALAQEGVVFEQAYAAAPWTLPSHAALFTGLHGPSHGTGWEHPRLEDGQARALGRPVGDFHTLAEEFALRGYETCSIHEKSWITAGSGLTQGFQRVFDFSLPAARDYLLLPRLAERVQAQLGAGPPPPPDKGGERIVATALDWLDGHRARDPERPFFLFLNLNEAHDPYLPPREEAGRFLPPGVSVEEALALPQDVADRKAAEERAHAGGSFDERELAILRALYDAEIRYQDRLLERLFQGLRDLELLESTVVVVTADHGEEFGHNGRLGHQLALTDPLLHVPLVMRFPQALRAGLRVSGLVSLVDVFPTLVDLVEVWSGELRPPSAELQALEGVSLLDLEGVLHPELLDQERKRRRTEARRPLFPEVRDYVLAHYDNPAPYLRTYPFLSPPPGSGAGPGRIEDFPLRRYLRSIDMIRTAKRKLLVFGDGERSFLDLEQDPAEEGEFLYLDPAKVPPEALDLEWNLASQLEAYRSVRLLLLSPLNDLFGTTSASAARGSQGTEQLGYIGSGADLSVPPEFTPRPLLRSRR